MRFHLLPRGRHALLTTIVAAVAVLGGRASPAAAAPLPPPPGEHPPLPGQLHVMRPFALPGQPWQPGNRGVDLAAFAGEPVYAAAGGVVVYAGMLAGRGVISVSHGSLRTTYEPVDPVVGAGARVVAGQLIGRVSAAADHCGPRGSCLHWGALRNGSYVDPMGLLRAPTIRLLPIWAALSGLFSEFRAQLQDSLGVHLTDAALGHTEHLTDLGQGQALVVVQRHDDLLALGQGVDRA
jgi:murein DD-endopeptidase MepM/ murein hydrolase activator NlpD